MLSNVAGNSFLTRGMQQLGDPGNTPLALIRRSFHPLVALGVALLIVWTLSHMALLSWADLSYVMPVTAIGYVVTAFAGRFFLGEHISPMRWTGIVLITIGVTLVGRTPPVIGALHEVVSGCDAHLRHHRWRRLSFARNAAAGKPMIRMGDRGASAVTNRYVIISTCAMAVSFFTFMKLVAIAPMSFAVPMSAACFIPEMLLARWLLKEAVDWRRWTGAGLIAIGVVFISQ